MIRLTFLMVLALLLWTLPGCSTSDSDGGGNLSSGKNDSVALGSANHRDNADDDDSDDEVEIPLSEVPQNVKDAALAAIPGIVLEEAERETENGQTIYCVEGEADGEEYEVEVSADGTVVEVETEDDDDDDDDD